MGRSFGTTSGARHSPSRYAPSTPFGRIGHLSQCRSLFGVVEVHRADAGGHVQAFATFDANRLQGHLFVATPEEHVRADANADCARRCCTSVGTGKSSGSNVPWREYQPDDLSLLCEPDSREGGGMVSLALVWVV
jgi:hypothetical protein